MDIKIAVKNKTPVYTEQAIVCNNSDYTVTWDLDEEWSGYDTKTMRCVYMDGTYADTVFSGGTCNLPVVTVPGVVQIGLYAGDIRTSRMAVLRALPSALTSGSAPADPPESVYNQLMELIKGMGGASEEDIAKAVSAYLTEHPVTETDPTVPAWAKAANKPTYTAADVGALSADTLQAATDAALAQAKASGEFDGKDGNTGPQGPKGEDGTDASVTAENIAAALGYTPVKAADVPSFGNKSVLDAITGIVTASKVMNPDHTTDLVQYDAFRAAVPMVQQMNITGATVGQTIKVKAVDSSGHPTKWEAVDMPSGDGDSEARRVIKTITIDSDDINSIYFNVDDDGNPFALTREVVIYMYDATTNTGSTQTCLLFRAGDGNTGDTSQNQYPIRINGQLTNYLFGFVFDIHATKKYWYGNFAHSNNTSAQLYRYVPGSSINRSEMVIREIKLCWNNTSIYFQAGATIVVEGL